MPQQETPNFTEADVDELERHAVRPDVAWRAGLRPSAQHLPGTAFTLLWPDAENGGLCQSVRIHKSARDPEANERKRRREKGAFGTGVTPGLRLAVGDHTGPAIIAEGYMQHLAVATWAPVGYAVYGMNGVNGVSDKNEHALPPFRGRDVLVIFDSDWRSNPRVRSAAAGLHERLRSLGAVSVRFVNVPGGGTDGIDDVLGRLPADGRAYFLWALIQNATELDDKETTETLDVHSVQDLRAEDWKPEWLIKRLWPYPGHGMLGGMEKTFKTWQLGLMAVAVASGLPCFGDDRFEVVTQGPVVFFTGEAGRYSLERRLRRIATKLHGLSDEEYDALPIYIVDQRAILTSDRFVATLRQVIADVVPVLVIVDPLYTYVGGRTDAGNVYAVGEALHAVSDICNEAKVSLAVGHHLRKTAQGHTPSLTDLTQAGAREWVKAWLLVHHLQSPDPDAGCAWLQVQAGGSEGYGGVYELDVCVGAFNVDTFDHDDSLWVAVRDSELVDPKEQREQAKNMQMHDDLLTLMRAVAVAGDYSDQTAQRPLAAVLNWPRDRVELVTDAAVTQKLMERRPGTQRRQLRGLTTVGRARLSL